MRNHFQLLIIGCVVEVLLNFLGCGKNYQTPILNLSNSIGLKMKREVIILYYRHKDGLNKQMQFKQYKINKKWEKTKS